MDFDKNKILTVVTADQAKVGMKGWVGNLPSYIEYDVKNNQPTITLSNVDLDSPSPFTREGGYSWSLFYPAPEPTYDERQAEWVRANNIKVGDKVRIIKHWDYRDNGFLYSYTGFDDGVFTIDAIYPDHIRGTHDRQKPMFDCHWILPYFAIEKVVDNDEKYTISEVVCITCGRRWIATRPESVKLKDMECKCGRGNVIETGELIATTVNKGE